MPGAPRYLLCTGECVPYEDLPKFPDSHIIGHLRYIFDNNRKVTALARWDVSTSAAITPPISPEIDCEIIGDVQNIKCRHRECKRKQRWVIGENGILSLMHKLGLQDKYLELERKKEEINKLALQKENQK